MFTGGSSQNPEILLGSVTSPSPCYGLAPSRHESGKRFFAVNSFCGVPSVVLCTVCADKGTAGGPGVVEKIHLVRTARELHQGGPGIRRQSTGWHAITTADITRGKDLT
ncbi:hypothetical protein GCM10009872_07180 [Actinopolymorpha rutila]